MKNLITILSIALTACSGNSGTDYFVTGSATQKIQISDIKEVEITCYCAGRVETKRSDSKFLSLTVTANSSSVGYHGEQEEPESVSPSLLEFSSEKVGSKLVLRSRERTYIHHASIINSLVVDIPYNVKLSIQLIEGSALEGRSIE